MPGGTPCNTTSISTEQRGTQQATKTQFRHNTGRAGHGTQQVPGRKHVKIPPTQTAIHTQHQHAQRHTRPASKHRGGEVTAHTPCQLGPHSRSSRSYLAAGQRGVHLGALHARTARNAGRRTCDVPAVHYTPDDAHATSRQTHVDRKVTRRGLKVAHVQRHRRKRTRIPARRKDTVSAPKWAPTINAGARRCPRGAADASLAGQGRNSKGDGPGHQQVAAADAAAALAPAFPWNRVGGRLVRNSSQRTTEDQYDEDWTMRTGPAEYNIHTPEPQRGAGAAWEAPDIDETEAAREAWPQLARPSPSTGPQPVTDSEMDISDDGAGVGIGLDDDGPSPKLLYRWVQQFREARGDETLESYAGRVHLRTWRYLNAGAARNVGRLLAPIARDVERGDQDAEEAYLIAPWLLLWAPQKNATDGDAREAGGVAAQVSKRCAVVAEVGWEALLEAFMAAERVAAVRAGGSETREPAPPDRPTTAAEADAFCRMGRAGQAGRGARNLLSSPIIQTCPQLIQALPQKIRRDQEVRTAALGRIAESRAPRLRASITEEDIAELEEQMTARAATLPAFSQTGLTGWRFDIIRALARHAAPADWRAILGAARHLLLGGGSEATRRFWGAPTLGPRYKKETMRADDPRPVGAPDPLYRWAVGTVMRMSKDRVAAKLGLDQYAIGVSAGAEAMVLAGRMDAEQRPEYTSAQGDVRNAYNEMCREAALEEAAGVSPLFGVVAMACYACPTSYVLPGQSSTIFVSDLGAIQGCPLGMALYCLATRRPVQWAHTTLQNIADGREGAEAVLGITDMPHDVRAQLTACASTHVPTGGMMGGTIRTRSYADNVLFSVPRGMEQLARDVAAVCLAVVGLQYKPGAWEAWSPTPGLNLPGFTVHPVADGMVVLGGALGPLDVVGILGDDSAVARRLRGHNEAITTYAEKLAAVPGAAAPAYAAPRYVLQALHRSLRQRVLHVARVYSPAVARSTLEHLDATLRGAVGHACGWSAQELEEAWPMVCLAPQHGGLGLQPLAPRAALHHLAGTLAATATGRLPNPEAAARAPAAYWGKTDAVGSARVRAVYNDCRRLNPKLPATLQELQARVDGIAADPGRYGRLYNRARGPRWGAILHEGLDEAALQEWERVATRQQRTHRAVLGRGDWALLEPPRAREYGRLEWLVAMRLWYGLDIPPAFHESDGQALKCGNVAKPRHDQPTRARCTDGLDSKGRHPLICRIGGSTIVRHNMARDVLGQALQTIVSGVWWERVMAEVDRKDGEEARLDLVVEDPRCAAMLDIVVFYPVRPNGVDTYKHADHERKKYDKYATTKDGRRRVNLPLIPVVVNVFGQVNELSVAYLTSVERGARKCGRRYRAEPGGPRSLVELVSLCVILTSASVVCQAFSRRKGELEHAMPPEVGVVDSDEAPEVGVVDSDEAGADEPIAERCTVCGLLTVSHDTLVSCMKCSRGALCHKAHDKDTGGDGRAATCRLGRCKESCKGRARGAE